MRLQLNNLLGWAMVIVTLALVGFWVPSGVNQIGGSYLIFFFHFPSALNCMELFLVAGVCSILYLRNKNPSMDLWAVSAIEVGMLGCTITLVTGAIWAMPAWGPSDAWITSDPRLLSVYLMWLTYAAYLALRVSMEQGKKRELFCAVFGVLAALNVPFVYFSIRIFADAKHPMEVGSSSFAIKFTQWFGWASFLVLYIALVRLRRRHYQRCRQVDQLQEDFNRARI